MVRKFVSIASFVAMPILMSLILSGESMVLGAGAPNPPSGSTVIIAPKVGGTLTATFESDTGVGTAVINANCKGILFSVGPRSAGLDQDRFEAATTQEEIESTFLGFGVAPPGCFSAAGGEGLDIETVLRRSSFESAEGLLVVAEVVMVGVTF